LPEARTGRKPAVRMAGKGGDGKESGVGEVRDDRQPMPEDDDHSGQRGVAGTVGRVAAMRTVPAVRLERERPGGHGSAGAGVGEDAR